MRKAKKDYIEKTIDLLGQAQLEIKRTLEAGKIGIALSLLGQCQEMAIELGNFIEKLEGEGFVTISFLEKYCEMLFRLYQELQQGQETKQRYCHEKSLKSLKRSLISLENSVKNDIKVRKEVVFLPYKASMWD